ncbi:hypothetical protein [Dapis sp. BLCC M229]|uniref:hypothetical protein n=1 Tax=Dapis sp. BLCC M229 TaxID=3400188 RepID=UPI003CF8FD5B
MLSIQKSGIDFEKNLPGGIVYSQFIEELKYKVDYRTRKKSYFFQKDGEIIAQKQLTITLFRQDAYQKLLVNLLIYYLLNKNPFHHLLIHITHN